MPLADYHYPDASREEVVPLLPLDARRILDVGCGYGGFGALIKRKRPHAEVWGVEQHPGAARVAAERLDRVVQGSFPGDLQGGRFDAVTFLDLLEHLEDPWSALESTHEVLAEGGAVIASIPNVRHYSVSVRLLLQGRWNYTEEGILDRTHLRFFTKRTAQEMFTSTGYEIECLRPLSTYAPALTTARGLGLRLVPRREELVTAQYGIVARAVRGRPSRAAQ